MSLAALSRTQTIRTRARDLERERERERERGGEKERERERERARKRERGRERINLINLKLLQAPIIRKNPKLEVAILPSLSKQISNNLISHARAVQAVIG